jgi:hypothetical protein
MGGGTMTYVNGGKSELLGHWLTLGNVSQVPSHVPKTIQYVPRWDSRKKPEFEIMQSDLRETQLLTVGFKIEKNEIKTSKT